MIIRTRGISLSDAWRRRQYWLDLADTESSDYTKWAAERRIAQLERFIALLECCHPDIHGDR
jgi:hypothetical protein